MKKILLVEDTLHLAEELADILQMEGFDVSVANNGIQGLELLNSTQPDLVITDLLMPKMDGFELIRQIRSLPQLQTLPVIALSAKTSPEDRNLAIQVGANNFIQKPCKAHELISAVRSLLA